MAKSANAGELRATVRFVTVSEGRNVDEDGYPVWQEKNVFGEGKFVFVKWVNAHGTDSLTAMQLQLREPATITMRYSPLIRIDQLVYKGSDPRPYEIISIDNVEERSVWLEIKVQRKEAAR